MATIVLAGGDATRGFDMQTWHPGFMISMFSDPSVSGTISPIQLHLFSPTRELIADGTFGNLDPLTNLPTTGTVNAIAYGSALSGPFSSISISGLAISVPLLTTWIENDDSVALNSALFDGADTFTGSANPDSIIGYGGADTINAGAGADTLIGGLGNDVLNGGLGNDKIDTFGLGEGNDSLFGGDGDDEFGANNADTIDGGDGSDTFSLNAGNSNNNLNLAGANTALGVTLASGMVIRNIENIAVATGSGADTLTVSLGVRATQFFAGGGIDTLIVDYSGSALHWSLNPGNPSLQGLLYSPGVGLTNTLLFEVEVFNVATGSGNDTLTGAAGNDTFSGGDGNDGLSGGLGANSLSGGEGDDDISFDAAGGAANTVNGGNGIDRLFVSNVSGPTLNWNTLVSGGGFNGSAIANIEQYFLTIAAAQNVTAVLSGSLTAGGSIDGTAGGIVQLSADFSAVLESVNLSAASLVSNGHTLSLQMFDRVTVSGGAGADTLTGIGGNDSLSGGGGSDTILGGGGVDTINGGQGDDLLQLTISADSTVIADGGDGVDIVELNLTNATSAVTITGTSFAGAATAFAGASTLANIERFGSIFLTTLNDSLSLLGEQFVGTNIGGFSGEDFLSLDYSSSVSALTYSGGSIGGVTISEFEAITLIGGAGNDEFVAPNFGGAPLVDYTFSGGVGDDHLHSAGGDDHLSGGEGADTLLGGAGADTLLGGAGDDRISSEDGGADSIDGGDDFDALHFDRQSTLTSYSISNALISAGGTLSDGTTISNFEAFDTVALGSGSDTLAITQAWRGGAMFSGGFGTDLLVLDSSASSSAVVRQFGNFSAFGLNTVEFDFEVFDFTTGDGADVIHGGVFNDSMRTGGGNDTVLSSLGDDYLDGGAGNDFLSADDGADTLIGGGGVDTLEGGNGDDTYFVDNDAQFVIDGFNQGNDIVWSSAASFVLTPYVERLSLLAGAVSGEGNEQDNVITGNDGANTLTGGGGADTLIGGLGNDTYRVDAFGDVVIEEADGGVDTIETQSNYVLTAANVEIVIFTAFGAGDLTGNNQANTLIGNGAANMLTGLGGNDTLVGGDFTDTLIGGLGDDRYVLGTGIDVVTELLDEGADTVEISLTYTLGANLENLVLTGASAINGFGNALANAMTGNGANNLLNGNGGADTLDGGVGVDTMGGGADNDTYFVDVGNDVVFELGGAGTDTINSTASFYFMSNDTEILNLLGSGNINATGNIIANLMTGNSGNNQLNGGNGNDTLDGGAGIDTLGGGGHDDTYIVDVNADVVFEVGGGGIDTILSTAPNYFLSNETEILTLLGSANISGNGNTLNNTITGNSGDNTLNGGAGADTLIGGAGNDLYIVDVGGDVTTELGGGGTDSVNSSASFYILGAEVENITLLGGGNIGATGNGLANTMTGNGGNNALNGGAGNDILQGGTGVDTMGGGANDDTYFVDVGSDVVFELAGAGTDTINSTASFFFMSNDTEIINLLGSANIGATGTTLANAMNGNSGNNALNGREGNDTLDGGAGLDTLGGGAGDDVYVVDQQTDIVFELAGAGTDTINSTATFFFMSNDTEIINLLGSGNIGATGNGLANIMNGNGGANALNGGGGNDTLDGGGGVDTLGGGAGDDTYYVDQNADVTFEIGGGGIDTILSTAPNYFLSNETEILTLLGSANISGNGNGLNNTINGNSGNNTINGGAGADTMVGGAGNDLYFVDIASDVVTEAGAGGVDEVRTSVGFTNLGAEIENITLLAGASGATANGLANVMIGNSAANGLNGGDGNDTIDGGAGADTLGGGAGDDLYTVDNASDIVFEVAAAGTDTVRSFVETYFLSNDVENALLLGAARTLIGNGSNNNVVGSGFADLLVGLGGNDTLDGGAGADTLDGGAGDDVFYVDSGSDIVFETAGNGTDIVFSMASATFLTDDVENLTLIGAGAQTGVGNGLANVIVGNAFANEIVGGAGADTLTGGAGADNFVFNGAPGGSNIDTISDFAVGVDKIYLQSAFFAALPGGTPSAAAFFTGAAAGDASDRIVYDSGTGALWYDSDGTGGAAQVQIAQLNAGLALSNSDFLVF